MCGVHKLIAHYRMLLMPSYIHVSVTMTIVLVIASIYHNNNDRTYMQLCYYCK